MLAILFASFKDVRASDVTVIGVRQPPFCTKAHFNPVHHGGVQDLGSVDSHGAEASLENRARERGLVVLSAPCRPRPLTLTMQNERTMPLASFVDRLSLTGRHALINVWAMWCAPCLEEMPSLLELQADTSLRSLDVVTINQDMNPLTTVPAFLEKKGWHDLETWFDVTRRLQTAFGAPDFLPLSFVMNPNGHVVAFLGGQADWTAPVIKSALRGLILRHKTSPTA